MSTATFAGREVGFADNREYLAGQQDSRFVDDTTRNALLATCCDVNPDGKFRHEVDNYWRGVYDALSQ